MLTMERLEGSNQYHCDTCNKKVDALKGVKVRKYPPVLTFSLCRFDFDYEKLERVKINDPFTFGLELDISVFAEKPELYTSDDERIYELCGVLIHRGDAFGGHYKAYIHDTMNEGDWEGLMAKYAEKKANLTAQTTTAATNDDQKMVPETNGHSKKDEMQIEKEGENNIVDDTKMVEEPQIKENKTDELPKDDEQKVMDKEESDDDEDENEESARPAKKKGKTTKGKRTKKKGKHHKAFGGTQSSKKNDTKIPDDKNKQKYDDSTFDDVEFPFPFTNQNLRHHWFDFNDSNVTCDTDESYSTSVWRHDRKRLYLNL